MQILFEEPWLCNFTNLLKIPTIKEIYLFTIAAFHWLRNRFEKS